MKLVDLRNLPTMKSAQSPSMRMPACAAITSVILPWLCSRFSSLLMYSIALRRISTFGRRWFGFGQVRTFTTSKASLTFFRRRRSRIVAALRRSTENEKVSDALGKPKRGGNALLTPGPGSDIDAWRLRPVLERGKLGPPSDHQERGLAAVNAPFRAGLRFSRHGERVKRSHFPFCPGTGRKRYGSKRRRSVPF